MKMMSAVEFLGIVKQAGVIRAPATTPLPQVVQMMADNHARSVILEDDENVEPVKILTSIDAALYLSKLPGASAHRAGLAATTIQDEDFVPPETSWLECAKILAEGGKTHLLLGRKGEHLQAVFTATDVLRWFVRYFAKWFARWLWGE